MKGNLAAFRVVERIVAPVVIKPDPKEKAEGEQAIDDGAESYIHGQGGERQGQTRR
jgi:hypothetical protein